MQRTACRSIWYTTSSPCWTPPFLLLFEGGWWFYSWGVIWMVEEGVLEVCLGWMIETAKCFLGMVASKMGMVMIFLVFRSIYPSFKFQVMIRSWGDLLPSFMRRNPLWLRLFWFYASKPPTFASLFLFMRQNHSVMRLSLILSNLQFKPNHKRLTQRSAFSTLKVSLLVYGYVSFVLAHHIRALWIDGSSDACPKAKGTQMFYSRKTPLSA